MIILNEENFDGNMKKVKSLEESALLIKSQ